MLEWGQLIFLAYIFLWSALKGVGQSVLPNSFASIRRIGLNYGALLSKGRHGGHRICLNTSWARYSWRDNP